MLGESSLYSTLPLLAFWWFLGEWGKLWADSTRVFRYGMGEISKKEEDKGTKETVTEPETPTEK